MLRVLIFLVSLGARAARAFCRRRADLVIENLALRQQVTALLDSFRHSGFSVDASGQCLASGHRRTRTALQVSCPSSLSSRKMVIRLARQLRAEDSRYEIPPEQDFGQRRRRPAA